MTLMSPNHFHDPTHCRHTSTCSLTPHCSCSLCGAGEKEEMPPKPILTATQAPWSNGIDIPFSTEQFPINTELSLVTKLKATNSPGEMPPVIARTRVLVGQYLRLWSVEWQGSPCFVGGAHRHPILYHCDPCYHGSHDLSRDAEMPR